MLSSPVLALAVVLADAEAVSYQRDVEPLALISDSGGGAYRSHLSGSGRLAVVICLQPRRRGIR